MAVDPSLMVLPDNKQKQGVYRRGSVAKSPSQGAQALRTDVKGASEAAEISEFLGEVTKWFPTYVKEVDKKNKEEMEEQMAEYKNASPKNKAAFRNAVANGDIEGRFSPWKMEGLRKAKAQEETRNYGNALFNEYNKSPVRESDDPEVMRNFIDEQNAKFKDKIAGIPNSILNDDFFPTRDALINSLIQKHKQHRENEFNAMEDQSFQDQVQDGADNLTPITDEPIVGIMKKENNEANAATEILNMCQGSIEKKLQKEEPLSKPELNRLQSTLSQNNLEPNSKVKETVDKILVTNGYSTGMTTKERKEAGYEWDKEVSKPENVVQIIEGAKLKEKRTGELQKFKTKQRLNEENKKANIINPPPVEESIESVDTLAYDRVKTATGLVSFKGHGKKSKQDAEKELKKLNDAINIDITQGKFALRKSGYGYQIVLVQSEKSSKQGDGKEILNTWLGEVQKGFNYGYPPGTAGAEAHTVTTVEKLGKGWDEKKTN